MAVARSQTPKAGGITAIHVALIAFVALWLATTVLLVLLHTDQEGLTKENDELRNDLGRLISSSDRQLRWYQGARAGGPTMVGLLVDELGAAAALATGEESDDVATMRTKASDLLGPEGRIVREALVPDTSVFAERALFPALVALYEAFGGEHQKRQAAEQRADNLEQRVQELTAAATTREETFRRNIEEIQQQLAALSTEHRGYRTDRDQAYEQLTQRVDDLRQQFSRDTQEQRKLNEQLRGNNQELQSRLDALREKVGELQIRPEHLITARQGDGTVVSAMPGEDIVYIDLGESDRVTRGLQFAVYSGLQGIPTDGRAKGRIEVVNVFATSAECRIVELLSSERVVDGDIVANPVYDRDRTLSFMVVGEFDLNGDGLDEPGSADQIRALIEHWGGQVVDELTARTDYLVVGNAPPKPVSSPEMPLERQQRNDLLKVRYDRYAQTVVAARSLSMPMLTQEVFMHFLGYAGTSQRGG